LPKPRGTTDRRVDALLTLLAENTTIVISGPKIAHEIGVTRHTVWRWVEKLRALGVNVKGHPRTGYRIEHTPDILAPQLLSHRLSGCVFGRRIFHFFKVDSTNNMAMRLGDEGEIHGALVIAEEQTAGRGRAGRAWNSERSAGIYMSVLLRPLVPPFQTPLLTLAAGLAAREAIAQETGLSPDIRWPNDILLGRAKVCGILTEMRAEPDRIHYAVVGIGINVNQSHMPDELADIATSLRIATGRTHSRVELLIRLLRQLERYYNIFSSEGPGPILKRFAEVSSYCQGKRVLIRTAGETFEGVTAGLEPNGVLRVRKKNGHVEPVISGDVAEAV
jgi:BirA family transcriptional regulator, biotin operon repressor / biotin---[acetyl-CoA-carboxylase] ligase